MAIFLGPAGIPISAKGSGTPGGVQKVAELGLNAMEVEFVRGVKMGDDLAKETGKAAEENGIRLSIHAPYYVNLLSPKKVLVRKSIQRIVDSLDRGQVMGADAIAVHAAYYGDLGPEAAMEGMIDRVKDILDAADRKGASDVLLGLETMAKHGQWGSLEEVIEVHRTFKKRVVPYLDWGHLFCRGGGSIDYAEILKAMGELKLRHINSHFNCVRKSKSGPGYVDIHEPLAKRTPDFAPLAKELVKRKVDITLICETPYIDQDALKMKEILEKAGYKWKTK